MSAASPRVIVIGAGIVGASIAYHLTGYGVEVVVLERDRPGAGTTGDSFGWINASYDNPAGYYRLRLQSILEFHRLERELGGKLEINWGGSVQWESAAAMPEFERHVRRHQDWGYPVRLIEPDDLKRLEPAIASAPPRAAYAAVEGSVDPAVATDALVAGAERRGATLEPGCEVTGFVTANGKCHGVKTSRGDFEAEVVALAAGCRTAALAERLGTRIPLVDSPGLLMKTRATAPLIRRLVLTPEVHMKQDPSGQIVAGEDFSGGTPNGDPRETGKLILGRARRIIPALADVGLASVTIGNRVMPADGMPIVGFADASQGAYVAAMHSGITLAPLIGRAAAREIVERRRVELLAPYRPERF